MFVHGNWVFGRLKQNIPVGARVQLGRTGDAHMDTLAGEVLGRSSDNICDTYIVLLDEPYMGQRAVNITEACICPIP